MYGLYEGVREGIAEVLDPSKLEYVILLHFEADDLMQLGRFVSHFVRARHPARSGTDRG